MHKIKNRSYSEEAILRQLLFSLFHGRDQGEKFKIPAKTIHCLFETMKIKVMSSNFERLQKISAFYFVWNPEICQDPPICGKDDLVLL